MATGPDSEHLSARARLGADLRAIRTNAKLTLRDLMGPTGSGHASNVENGKTQPSWDFIEKYLRHGGDIVQIRSSYELSRHEFEQHKDAVRRRTQPGSFRPKRPPQSHDGVSRHEVRQHYFVAERVEHYRFNSGGVAEVMRCSTTIEARTSDTALFYCIHSYDADPREGVLDIEAGRGCSVEFMEKQPTGTCQAYLRLDHALGEGERHTFDYSVHVKSDLRARPILLAHPGGGTDKFELEASFVRPSTPSMLWWFQVPNELAALVPNQDQGMQNDAGTYSRVFASPVEQWCYGFGWQW